MAPIRTGPGPSADNTPSQSSSWNTTANGSLSHDLVPVVPSKLAQRHFAELKTWTPERFEFRTNELRACAGEWTKISEASLATVLPLVNVLRVTKARHSTQMIQINVEVRSEVCDEPTGQRVTVKVKPDSKIGILHDAIEKVLGIARDAQRLLYGGRRVDITSGTFADYGIKSGDTIIVYNVLRGGKPVIYLFSPVEREVSVKLSLVPQWEFSAIYPVVPVKTASAGSGQEIEWTVTTSADGSLKERTTGLEVAYLFWEAETTRVAPLSPPPTPTIAATDPGDGPLQEVFVPNDAHLCSENSVVVETSKVTPYLDGALKALGLHTEARTSFITFVSACLCRFDTNKVCLATGFQQF
ncbi:ubiquitin family protein, variant 2 [Coprinopsis cinerea AmutBmut pab1-1]|nr:ubiquitin family protein, variant 2 [Coprinopsis cinerea AmutBmut pab1-1]